MTNYQGFFGKYHDLTAGEAEILKYKKFSELKISSILTQQAKAYMENWFNLVDDTNYRNLAICVLRNIYTHMKSTNAGISHYTERFQKLQRHQLIEQPRYDLMEHKIKKEDAR